MTRLVGVAADSCAREPIHLSGAIQAHGYLISCALPDWSVRHVSTNIETLLEAPVEALLGHSLREYVSEEVLQAVLDTVALLPHGATGQRAGQANLGPMGTPCDLVVHVADDLVHIEIEPRSDRGVAPQPTALAQSMISAVAQGASSDFHAFVAEQVRLLTGYDRVMVYRFRHDGAGEVIAECADDAMEPLLGLRYPASDIPPQARALYLRNRLRVIPDVDYSPVPIVPGVTADGRPLDLSQHALRSVAPVHLEYLRNMGVGASMSISIISGGRLWGLIACHHRIPRLVPPVVRAAADLFGMFVSMRVSAAEQQATMAHFEHAQSVRDALAQRLAQAQDFDAALADELPLLRTSLRSDGAAVWSGARWRGDGAVPDPRRLPGLLGWLQAQGAASMAMTERAEDWAAPVAGDPIAGVFALRLGADDWLVLFRREEVEEVEWAGRPDKALVHGDDGRIAPRRSFAIWREQVRGRSAPWTDADRRGAGRLHQLVTELRRRIQTRAHVPAFDQQQRLQAMQDRRQRLDQLAQLLDGLSHLQPATGARLDERIDALEAELQRLADVPPVQRVG
jgi:light-regulated signal transduction histidine kinase (bacteriophytochrome)